MAARSCRAWILPGILAAFLAGCGKSAPKPRLEGRILALSYVTPDGAGDVKKGGALIEIFTDSRSGEVFSRPLVDVVFAAQVSPDGSRILYAVEKEIRLRELKDGADRAVVSEDILTDHELARIQAETSRMDAQDRYSEAEERQIAKENIAEDVPIRCDSLSWAPDGRTFSYAFKNHLFVSDLNGAARKVWSAPQAAYDLFVNGKYSATNQRQGMLGAAIWVSPTSFVFQRFVGVMPERLPEKLDLLADNTSTVAVIGDEITLTDFPKRIYVYDTCPRGPYVLFRTDPADPQMIASDFARLDAVPARRLWETPLPEWRFLPVGCGLYTLQNVEGNLHFLQTDPETLKAVQGVKVGRGIPLGSLPRPDAKMIALAENDSDDFKHLRAINVSLVDLTTGRKARIFQTGMMKYSGWKPLVLLAWI